MEGSPTFTNYAIENTKWGGRSSRIVNFETTLLMEGDPKLCDWLNLAWPYHVYFLDCHANTIFFPKKKLYVCMPYRSQANALLDVLISSKLGGNQQGNLLKSFDKKTVCR